MYDILTILDAWLVDIMAKHQWIGMTVGKQEGVRCQIVGIF